MAEIRALVVDDEPLARRGVRQLLEGYPDITVVGECRNGREALRALATLKPGLVFLDIQMPGLDGFEVLRYHGVHRMPAVVFVTAHDEFAVRAFEAQALDYLVKPLSAVRFRATIARVRERLQLAGAREQRDRLTRLLEERGNARIAVTTPSGDLMIDSAEITWVGAEDYYAGVHVGGRKHRVRESLSALEARLDPARFVRVHRGAIVRLDQVREFRHEDAGSGAVLILQDGTRIPVSRRRQGRVRGLLRQSTRR